MYMLLTTYTPYTHTEYIIDESYDKKVKQNNENISQLISKLNKKSRIGRQFEIKRKVKENAIKRIK